MASTSSVIRPLPTDAIAQIRSSITITSLNGVVIELLKNSLDAQARKVDISIDYPRGSCTVEDDGFGIRPAEFKDDGGLGRIHHTSKHDRPNTVYGDSGIFLFSLAALSLVQITSRHHLYHSLNSLSINRSQVIARQTPAAAHQNILSLSHGTRVVVRDLFGNMPVRIKQRVDDSHRACGNDKDWEELRKLATGLTLAWPKHVTITIRDITSNRKIHFRGMRETESQHGLHDESAFVAHVCGTLSQAMLISSPDQSKWIPVNASTPMICIQGVISLEPVPTKTVQFISLDIHPLNAPAGHNLLYEEINHLFKKSSFGTEGDMADFNKEERKRRSRDSLYKSDGFMQRELKGAGKGIDRWPMFFIRIEYLGPVSYHIGTKGLVNSEPGVLDSVVELLQVMLLEFLRRHHFMPRYRRRLDSSQNLHLRSVKSSSNSNQIHRTKGNNASHAGTQKTATKSIQAWLTTCTADRSRGSASSTTLKSYSIEQAQNHGADSLFNAWSRIKNGKRLFTASTSERPCISEKEEVRQDSQLLGSYNATGQSCAITSTIHVPNLGLTPSRIGYASNSEEVRDHNRHDLPTVTKSGRLNRLPFGDIPLAELVESNGQRVTKQKALPLLPSETSGSDGLMSWMNPITKKKSFFNSRTGLAVPPATLDRAKPPHTSMDQPAHQDKLTLPSHSKISSLWINGVLQNWTNPIFYTGETPIPQVGVADPDVETHQGRHGNLHHYSQLEMDRAFQASSARLTARISKSDLRQAQIISQVDKKFILVKLASRGLYPGRIDDDPITETLILVDQHAADERCRIEDLLAELCTPPSQNEMSGSVGSQQSGIFTSALEKPLHFTMSQREIDFLYKFSQHFANWGILYELPPLVASKCAQTEPKIIVRSLPPVIIEKCRLAPKLLIELLRSEAWKCYDRGGKFNEHGQLKDNEQPGINTTHSKGNHAWLKKIHGCPQGILDMLTSRSCRSAIMFNDELSDAQCKALLSRLTECAFPFQCAHGRPSMIPLVDLGMFHEQRLTGKCEDIPSPGPFNSAFKRWKRSKAAITDQLPRPSPTRELAESCHGG